MKPWSKACFPGSLPIRFECSVLEVVSAVAPFIVRWRQKRRAAAPGSDDWRPLLPESHGQLVQERFQVVGFQETILV
jgi:hypothetical protein